MSETATPAPAAPSEPTTQAPAAPAEGTAQPQAQAATPKPAPAPSKPLSPTLAAVTQREVKAREAQKALEAKEKALAEKEQALAAQQAKWEAERKQQEALKREKPHEWLKANNVDLRQLTDAVLSDGKLSPEQQAAVEAAKVKEELGEQLTAKEKQILALQERFDRLEAERKAEADQLKREREEQAQRAQEQEAKAYFAQGEAELLKAPDKFPLVLAHVDDEGQPEGLLMVRTTIIQHAQRTQRETGTPEVLSYAEAAAKVEARLRKAYGAVLPKVLTNESLRVALGVQLPASPAAPQPSKARPPKEVRGVSNAAASSAPPSSMVNPAKLKEERKARALAAIPPDAFNAE